MTPKSEDTEATRSIEIADRRRELAEAVLTCDPAMVTALEGVLGLEGRRAWSSDRT